MLVRIDVHHRGQFLAQAQRADQRDALGSGAPDRHRLARLPGGLRDVRQRLQLGVDLRPEFVYEPRRVLQIVLLPEPRHRGPRRGTRLEHQVLTAIRLEQLEHLEAALAEQAGQRAAREVRAVLVVHVPEHSLLEHALHVRQLEEYIHMRALADGVAHQADEFPDGTDVLQRVPAADVVCLEVRILRSVEVGDEADTAGRSALCPLRTIPGVEPDAVAAGALAQRDEEFSLAATDLQHRGARADAVLRDLVVADVVDEAHEAGREGLRLLICGGVVVQVHIEADVGDEAAVTAESQLDVAARKGQRRIAGGQHQAAVSRHVVDLVEGVQVAPATGLADDLPSGDELGDRRKGEFRGACGAQRAPFDGLSGVHSIAGRGTGTMKRPPRRRYSACWLMISSWKFQGRMST